jgi:CelD/BcsL family acetyltransferase involved in cellulose biosynthesis
MKQAARKLPHVVRCFDDLGQLPDFLMKAHAVSCRSWQAKRLGMAVSPQPADHPLLAFAAEMGALRSYVLEQNEQPIAFAICTQWNGGFLYDRVGFDPAFSEYSPGKVLLYRIIEDLLGRNTPRTFDFGEGDSEYKRIFGTRSCLTAPLALVRPAARPRLLMGGVRVCRALSRGTRATLKRFGLFQHLRQLYRG